MRRTINDIITELNTKLTTHKQKHYIIEYTRTFIRFSNNVIFDGESLKKYRNMFIKGGKDRYFKHHDAIVCSPTPLKTLECVLTDETQKARKEGGKTCQQTHGEKIKNNLNTGTPWNTGLTLPPSWNAGLTKFDNESVMRISKAKEGKNNPCFGKVYTQQEKDNLSSIMKQKILDGTFTPAVKNSLTHWKAEWNGKKYRSTWERNFHISNPTLKYELIRIPYTFKDTNHVYITDFVDTENKIVYEIKPSNLTDTPKVLAKSSAARDWCAINGYKFIIVTELTESCLQDENKKHKRD